MKKNLTLCCVLALSLCPLFFTGCEKNLYSDKTEGNENKPFEFNFATSKNHSLDINYHLPEGYEIIFEVYTENPINEYGVKMESASPVFKGMTSNGGQYSSAANQCSLTLPTYVKEVYVYSGSVGVPEVVKVPVGANGVFMNTATAPVQAMMSNPVSKAGSSQYLTLGGWSTAGVPDYITKSSTISASLLKDINYSLPKSKSVVERHPDFLKPGIVTNVNIIAPTELEIILTHTGASMKNTLAYFQYTTGQIPTSEADIANQTIIFPNLTSSLMSNGLNAGDKVKLKYWNGSSFENTFPAGVSIGWVMFVNAYQNGNVTEVSWKNYSIPALNTGEDADKQQHNILLYDKERDLYIIAFEDQKRSTVSDNDFHDAIFCIQASENYAIDNNGVADADKWIDTDKDGVCDVEDEFPNDPTAAFSIHYPAKDINGTLAFEDLWPSRGDFDMNDVVVFYHSIHQVNAYNRIARTEDKFDFVYSGAGLEDGFGYQLGIPSNKVKKLNITSEFPNSDMSMFKFDSKGLEANQSKATVILASNVGDVVQGNSRRASYTVKTEFTSNLTLNEVTTPPYNPFLLVNSGAGKRDKEVHLPYFAPTDLADMSNFGAFDDRSDITKGSYFLSYSYFPFAINLPEEFAYPDETIRIDVNYPEFVKWAESQGTTNQDWYKNKKQ